MRLQGGNRVPPHPRTRRIMRFEMVGVKFHKARDQVVAVEVVRGFHADAGVLLHGAALRAAGDVVDDPAGGAQAVLGAGPVDHLDALDHGHIDGVAIAGAVAQRRGLRHAIDQHQRRAATESLAGAAHLLPARRIGGNQVAEDLAVIGGDRQLLLDLLTADHRDLLRRLARLALGAGGTDGDGFQFDRLFGVNGGTCKGRTGQGNA